VLGGFLAIVIITTATDMAMHATGVFPPLGEPMGDALFLLAGLSHRVRRRGLLHRGATRA
jgi:hypothetical protein